ncbi:hypothetical protein [Nonomuraea sp. NPDC049480]|uniref:hypothetical protein n=1 Tax=Nonomuraea sp. NPDC049480 TaxID=3364353 RepID=UPI0037A0D1F2
MNFEEQILMELKAEIAARNERRRRTGRRLLAGAAVAGLAAVAAVAVPMLTGSETPAYALTQNSDGTIRVLVNEFRDADRLERDLGAMGVTADVTYVKPGKWCKPDRGQIVGGDSTTHEDWRKTTSYKAAQPATKGIEINPRYIGKGQTLVLEFTENADQTSGPEKPRALWQFSARVMSGPVKPCVVIDNPSWNDPGGPEAQPPAGS